MWAAPKHRAKPWALYVGFVSPHFPLIAPPQFYDLYPEDRVPWPDMYDQDQRPRHPFTDAMRKCLCFDEAFDGAAMDGGVNRDALRGRTDTGELGGDPDARFPGADEDPTMTAGDAGSGFGAGVVSDDDAGTAAGE